MSKTRLSLFYLVTYLSLTGLGLMFAPQAVLQVLMASNRYDDVMPRFLGVMMLALGLVVSQIVRFRLEQLYPITVLIRLGIWFFLLWVYLRSGEVFLLAVLGVLGLGILLTGSIYLMERGKVTARA